MEGKLIFDCVMIRQVFPSSENTRFRLSAKLWSIDSTNITCRSETLWKELEACRKAHWVETRSINLKSCLKVLYLNSKAFSKRRFNDSSQMIWFQYWSTFYRNGRWWWSATSNIFKWESAEAWLLLHWDGAWLIHFKHRTNECW